MVITLSPELEAAITREAEKSGANPSDLAVKTLWDRFIGPLQLPEPRDEWERRLREIGRSIGANLSDEALSREQMYD